MHFHDSPATLPQNFYRFSVHVSLTLSGDELLNASSSSEGVCLIGIVFAYISQTVKQNMRKSWEWSVPRHDFHKPSVLIWLVLAAPRSTVLMRRRYRFDENNLPCKRGNKYSHHKILQDLTPFEKSMCILWRTEPKNIGCQEIKEAHPQL